MARFILDIANLNKEQIKVFQQELIEELIAEIVTITCIDETNSHQFNEDKTLNTLSKEQIEAFNNG